MEMKVRYVGKDILYDFIGMNPAFAKIIGFEGIADDEVVILEGMAEDKTQRTIKHEIKENELIKSGMDYWSAHIQSLQEEKGLATLEVKSMENMIRKTITCAVVEVEDRILDFVGSNEEVDRMGDIVHCDGWRLDNYMKNPVFMWVHDYKSPPIGKAVKVWRANHKLMFRIEFAPKETYEFADTCYKLYKGGFLNAVSVGFAPDEESIKSIDGGGNEYTSQELLELSGVPIPACTDALVSARKAKVITMKEYKLVTKPEETEDYIRIPVKDCKITATIDISKDEGIKALYCGEEKEIATYLFAKAKGWTMEKAKKWVEDHKKSVEVMSTLGTDLHNNPVKKEISQEEIKDELDYIHALIQTGDFSEENRKAMKGLLGEIVRFLGCDNPIDINTIEWSLEELDKMFETAKSKFGGK